MSSWRREPPTTLKAMTTSPVTPRSAPATQGLEVSPTPNVAAPSNTKPPSRMVAAPRRRLNQGATTLPSTPPAADPVSSNPNPTLPSPSRSWANSTRIASWATPSRLITATMTARVRSTRCASSQRSPSAISARRLGRPAGPAAGGTPGPVGGRPNCPSMVAISAELAPKETASTASGIHAATENRNPPAGGPTSWLATIWVPCRRPLARSSRAGSRDTSAGTIDCWAVSTSVWPVPSRKPTATSSAMLARSRSTATARPPTTAKRPASTVHITSRRSQRSSRAPLTSPNSSHGSHSAKVTSDTLSGSRVRVAASSGRAVR